jgi:hypothetical protein
LDIIQFLDIKVVHLEYLQHILSYWTLPSILQEKKTVVSVRKRTILIEGSPLVSEASANFFSG